MTQPESVIDTLNQWMHAHHMHGFWMQGSGGAGAQIRPHIWPWADVHSALSAVETPPPGLAGRGAVPTIAFRNPGRSALTSTSLRAGILAPGDVTGYRRLLDNRAHLAIQAPTGATLTVEGEPFPFASGDLVTVPAGMARAFVNGREGPLIWLEVSDADLRALLGGEHGAREVAFEASPPGQKPPGSFAAVRSDMTAGTGQAPVRAPVRYPWTEVFTTLTALRDGERAPDVSDGALLRYISPVDGGPTFPTFSCEVLLLAPGFRGRRHRHNSTATYHVLAGEGRTQVADQHLAWRRGDTFCIPPWTWHQHENPSMEDSVLFSFDDTPAMVSMGFYRLEHEPGAD